VFGSPLFAAIFFAASAIGASAQTTVTLSAPGTQVNADMTIQGGSSALTDFSNSPVLASKASSSDAYDRRILFKFDTQDYVPANAVITSAKLQLVLKAAESSAGRPLTAYYITKSFADGQTNWHYYRTGQAWSTAGGDLGASFATTNVGNAVGSTYTFDLTKLVQRTVNGEFGSRYTRVALVDMGGADSGSYREFHSSRSTSTSLRPRLVVTYSTSGSSTPSPAPSISSTGTGTTLKVMQWNIHNTKGSDGVCNPDRVAGAIVKQNPQVVSLNEVKFYAGACSFTFDMSVKLQSLLQQKTGVTWYLKSIYADGTGNVLLSRLPLVTASSHLLSYSAGVAQVGVVVNGRTINLSSTHVEYYNASWRTAQIKEVVSWLTGFSSPRIVMGDFNTNPGTSDYNLLATPYQDAWAAAKSAGTATSYNGSGATHGASRFDYVFYSRTSTLVLKSVSVPDTRVSGVYPSDHDPVIAVFGVN
jgi:endonuclease/exonuclease/phosphatase family metal-dependent hydrolase